MASYTSLAGPTSVPVGDIWQQYASAAGPANWSQSVPPLAPPVIVTVNVPAGQVSFG